MFALIVFFALLSSLRLLFLICAFVLVRTMLESGGVEGLECAVVVEHNDACDFFVAVAGCFRNFFDNIFF